MLIKGASGDHWSIGMPHKGLGLSARNRFEELFWLTNNNIIPIDYYETHFMNKSRCNVNWKTTTISYIISYCCHITTGSDNGFTLASCKAIYLNQCRQQRRLSWYHGGLGWSAGATASRIPMAFHRELCWALGHSGIIARHTHTHQADGQRAGATAPGEATTWSSGGGDAGNPLFERSCCPHWCFIIGKFVELLW